VKYHGHAARPYSTMPRQRLQNMLKWKPQEQSYCRVDSRTLRRYGSQPWWRLERADSANLTVRLCVPTKRSDAWAREPDRARHSPLRLLRIGGLEFSDNRSLGFNQASGRPGIPPWSIPRRHGTWANPGMPKKDASLVGFQPCPSPRALWPATTTAPGCWPRSAACKGSVYRMTWPSSA